MATLPLPVLAQMRLEIRPSAVALAAGGPTSQTFEVHVMNYNGLGGMSVPIFYDPTVVSVASTSRRGEYINNGGGNAACFTTYSNPLMGILQVDCSDFVIKGPDYVGYSGADGIVFAFVMQRVGPGATVLTFNDDYYNYSQNVRIEDYRYLPITTYTLGNATVAVDRPLPAAAAMRTLLDFELANRDSVDATFYPVGTTGVLHRVRNNGNGVRLTAARYDVAPPGGNTSPVSDPDGTLTDLGTLPRYWEITSSSTGAYLQDVSFSYAGLDVYAPTQLRLARRALTDDGSGAWQLYPAARAVVNTADQTVTLVSNASGDVTTGQYALVANESALPVELVAFTGRADGAAVALAWETASETNNAGFAVEQQTGEDGLWSERGFVAGHGTSAERHAYAFRVEGLAPGRHAFRLRQVDTDGAVHHSAAVEVEVGLGQAPYRVVLRGANPVHSRLAAAVFVARAQKVRLSLVDATGREAAVLYDGPAEAGAPLDVRLDASALTSGLYWLRGVGEHVRFAHPVVVAR